MLISDWKVKIIDVGYTMTRDIFIYREVPVNKIELLRTNAVNEILSDGQLGEPTLRLPPETLQAFANALADFGIKPQEGFLEGKLEATEKHLEDMRTLVFKNEPNRPNN